MIQFIGMGDTASFPDDNQGDFHPPTPAPPPPDPRGQGRWLESKRLLDDKNNDRCSLAAVCSAPRPSP